MRSPSGPVGIPSSTGSAISTESCDVANSGTSRPRCCVPWVALATADELAARTLLQALLPGIVSFARRSAVGDPSVAIGEMVSIAWERIRTYPLHRPGSVAANVLWDTRSCYWKEHLDPRCSTGLPRGAEDGPATRPS